MFRLFFVSRTQPRLRRALIIPVMALGCLALASDPVAAQHSHDGPLPHGIPDFCAVPNAVMSAGPGSWSNPATWSGLPEGAVPGAGDVVIVHHDVTYDAFSDVAIRALCIEGRLQFVRDANTRLTVGTLMVKPGGDLEIGTAAAPVDAGVKAEIVIANQAFDPADLEQFGTGLLGIGKTTIHGATKTPTWVRLAVEPRAGHTTLTLEQPVSDWNHGDRLILPDTRHLKYDEVMNVATRIRPQWEELTVQSISPDGKQITLNETLKFDHLGARDADKELRLLPHVGNLTRNVVIRSEMPIGGGGVQGHVLFTHRAEVDIRYAALRDLGRTRAEVCPGEPNNLCAGNQIGRYPMHFHHLMGPVAAPANGYQYTFVGNAIDGGSTNHDRRWGVAIHDTHYGLVSDNVAYNYAGALFTTEDGTESYNLIQRNFAVRGSGTGDRTGHGNEGMGFWFRGPNNYVRGNVAADLDSDAVESAYGFKYFMHSACLGCDSLASIKIPMAPGQDPSQYITVSGNALPILQFENNEVYSAAEGLTYWWLNSGDRDAAPAPKQSVFKDLRIWHVYNIGIYHYPAANVLIDGLQIFGDTLADNPGLFACCGRGFHGEDYAAKDVVIRNAEIDNMLTGISWSTAGTGLQIVENSTLRNNFEADISVGTMYSANGGDWLPARKIIARNVRFGSARSIVKDWDWVDEFGTPKRDPFTVNTEQTDELFVYAYQGNPNDNFQVFFKEQATTSVAGGMVPADCSLTPKPEIFGIVCNVAPETPVNSAPSAVADSYSTNEDVTLTVPAPGVLTNDTDGEGNSLTAILVSSTTSGTLALSSDGLFTYTPNSNFNGIDSFTYKANDGALDSNVATVTITVNLVNDPPVANDDAITIFEDALETVINVIANDTDVDSVTLTVISSTPAANGSVRIGPEGRQVFYRPNANFCGTDSFTYTLSDGNSTDTATVTVTISPCNNDPPVAVADTFTIAEDAGATVLDVLANDINFDGRTLRVLLCSVQPGTAHGTVTIPTDKSHVIYTPDPNFNGVATFSCFVGDTLIGLANANPPALVTVNVTAVNDAPVANDDAYSTNEDVTLTVGAPGVLANDTDVENDALTAMVVTNPANGTLTLNAGGSFSYMPNANFNGTDSFTYKVNDGTSNSNTATVRITVNAVNDPPTAVDDAVTVDEDSAERVIDVLANDTDVDGGTLQVIAVTQPANGVVRIGAEGRQVFYRPNANFCGTDSFEYTVSDGQGGTDTGKVTITVTCVNDAPNPRDDEFTIPEDSGPTVLDVLANDTNVDQGERLHVESCGTSTAGTVTVPPGGTHVVFTPNRDFSGDTSFVCVISDGVCSSANCPTSTVVVHVTPVNDAPVANDDSYSTNEDVTLTVDAPGVLANDTDVDSATLTAVLVSGPANGTLTLNANGSFSYVPNANFNGTDVFTYKANDGTADSNVATVTITVNGVNDAPVAKDDSYSTNEDMTLNVAAPGVLANDTDADGNTLAAVVVSTTTNGTLTLNADGSFTYTPNANFNGTDSFTYRANDGTANSADATVTITVTAVNDAPTIAAIANQTGTVGVPVTPVTAVGSDVDAGDTLSYSASTLPPGLGIDPVSGTISGTPTIAGIFHVTVTVTDSSMASASTSFDWVIESPIVVNPGDQVNAEGDRVRLRIETTLSLPGRGGVKFTATGLPAGLDINASGLIHGRIDENAAGVYTVVVTVTKDDVSASVSFKWTVLDDNRAPRIEKQQDRWHDEGDAVWMGVEAGDPDGDRLTFTQEGLPPGLELDARNGVIRGQFTRMTSVGTHVVTITVSDGSLTASQTFRWTIREKNRAPWMPQPGNRNNYEDDTVFFQLPGADPDWDSLTVTATGLPPGVIVDTDGTVYGHLPLASAGMYVVTLTLSDGRESASATFTWIVAPRPRWTLWWQNQNYDDDHADEDDRKKDEDDTKKDEQADEGDGTKNQQADDGDGTKTEHADEGDGTKNEHADEVKNDEQAADGDGTKNEHADEGKKDEKTNQEEAREEQKN